MANSPQSLPPSYFWHSSIFTVEEWNKSAITSRVAVSRVPYRESHTSTSSLVHPTVEAIILQSPWLWMTWSWSLGGTLALGLYWRSIDCRPFTPGNCFFRSFCAKLMERSDNFSQLLILLTSVSKFSPLFGWLIFFIRMIIWRESTF